MTWEGLNPPYATIVADPPWSIERKIRGGGRRRTSTEVPYSFLTDDDIADLPVVDLAAADASCWLWITAQRNRAGVGLGVLSAWGFRCSGEFVWAKPNLGMGSFPRTSHEIVLFGTRGAATFVDAPRDVHSVQRWAQVYGTNGGKSHSAKPAAFYDLVERVSPAPYVELFARQPRLGWDHWGYGYESGMAS